MVGKLQLSTASNIGEKFGRGPSQIKNFPQARQTSNFVLFDHVFDVTNQGNSWLD